MFDEYAKKLKDLNQDVPKIFERIAKRGAIKFVNEAKNRTDNEGLVDTGNYKRHWSAQVFQPTSDSYGVLAYNNVDYASHLEYGHKTRSGGRVKGRFVGELSLVDAKWYCLEQLEKALKKAFKKK